MAAPQIVSLPEFFTLASGNTIRLTAVDATTGALVSGVVISGVSIDVEPTVTSGPTVNPVYLPNFSLGDMAA